MARDNTFISGVGIAAVATTLAMSPRARRAVRKVVKTAIRGTHNLQEASKHVTRFSDELGPDHGFIEKGE